MSAQQEAMQLAAVLEAQDLYHDKQAADELRRLHAVNQQLLAALKLALEALKYPLNQSHENFNVDMAELLAHRAITALREALAEQPAQPSKPWVGLTQQDINIAFDDTQEGGGFDDFARAIEAKLREKNAPQQSKEDA